LAPGIPKEVHWAYDPRGIEQIGCVYTAQGFEFDYVGVIWGPDLAYDSTNEAWRGNREASHDQVVRGSGERFIDLVKNTYRVLLSRGLKGCYVYFMDNGTETYIRNRCEGLGGAFPAAETLPAAKPARESAKVSAVLRLLPANVRVLPRREVRPYVNAVPLLDLNIAAGHFSGEQPVLDDEIEWVQLPETFNIGPDVFIAQVVGESMNRRIPNGAWCVFRANPVGSRQGKVVIVEHRQISDADTGSRVTVKIYESEKVSSVEGEWRHSRIVLKPDSTASHYRPIVLEPQEGGDLRVVAELVAVLG
jgi:uncharacterized protein